jgi:hypothetical protein
LGSLLELAINSFESVKRIQELETGISHLLGVRPELLGMLYGESDAINAMRAWYAISNSIGVGETSRSSISAKTCSASSPFMLVTPCKSEVSPDLSAGTSQPSRP